MAQPARHVFGKPTALIVDDDPEIRVIMARALEADGYRAVVAGDGREALRWLADQEADVAVIVADLQMPHLDGRMLAAHLAERDTAPPILFVSGYAPGGTNELPGPFLAKPFTPGMLRRRVRELLGR